MASRSTNTQAEALQNLVKSLAEIKMMPDADLPFLIGMETQILQYLHSKLPGGAGDQLPPMQDPNAQPMGQMPTGIGPGGPPGGMAPPLSTSGAPAGIGMHPAAPNPDELRRMLHG